MHTVFEKIHAFHANLSPSKVARKYTHIRENPFRFFRGTNPLFYQDLSGASIPESPFTWICGDLHLENFGSYKGDNRLVYFDINDFDESILAPVAWELARVLTSMLLAFDALKITKEESRKVCEVLLTRYSEILRGGSPKYVETRTATGIVRKFLNAVEKRSQLELLSGRTKIKNGRLKLANGNNKQLKIDKELKSKLIKVFKVLDARFRLAGTGSLGIRRYLFLIEKCNDASRHMLIDMKQATPSSLLPYLSKSQPQWDSEAIRMVTIQRTMQNIPPAQLSTLIFEGESYLMQELQPTRDRINFKIIKHNFKDICMVISDMAMLTASAHLRAIGRKGSCSADDLISFGTDDSWKADLILYAVNYKEKTISDFNEFNNHFKLKKAKKNKKQTKQEINKVAV